MSVYILKTFLLKKLCTKNEIIHIVKQQTSKMKLLILSLCLNIVSSILIVPNEDYSVKKLSVHQIADMFEDEEFCGNFDVDDHVRSGYIEPPDNRELVDEDSGGLLDNISKKQLLANAEILMDSGKRMGNYSTFDESDDIPDDVPL
ncbi:hypothetical protein FQA39_LY08682 [Lamprigera yunnana]|nr:hypothetical protein FQA39_LY08682 [Lamprigera yunnana]